MEYCYDERSKKISGLEFDKFEEQLSGKASKLEKEQRGSMIYSDVLR